jgi:hypothetical protein
MDGNDRHMKLYPETPARRFGQVLVDLVVLAWVAAWVLAGREVHRLIDQMAKPGVAVEQAGDRLAGSMGAVQDQVSRIPAVGNDLRAPFGRVGEAGQALARAGATQQEVVHELAIWLGVLIALIPVVVVLVGWLPGRVRWVREASAASRLRLGADTADLGLFALRAIATRSLPELRRASADPLGDLQRGDYRALATLELRALGLRADASEGARRHRSVR